MAELCTTAPLLLACLCLYASAVFGRRVPYLQHSPGAHQPGAHDWNFQKYNFKAHGIAIGPSQHECETSPVEARFTVCHYQNLAFFDKQFFYVVADSSSAPDGLPKPSMSLYDDEIIFKPTIVTLKDFQKETYGAQIFSANEAYIAHQTMRNYGHSVSEVLPSAFNTICKYLAHCNHTSRIDYIAITSEADLHAHPNQALSILEAWSCFAVNPPVFLSNGTLFKDKVILFHNAFAGIGKDCRAHRVCNYDWGDTRDRISSANMIQFREHMATCIGFNSSAIAPLSPPNVLVVDRYFESMRHMLNIVQVMAALQYYLGDRAHFRAEYLEGMSLNEQARLYSNTSVVVQAHGSAMANLMWLPHGAVVVALEPHPHGLHNQEWIVDMVRDLRPWAISMVSLVNDNPLLVSLDPKQVMVDPKYKGMSWEAKLKLLEESECPQGPLFGHCESEWFRRAINYQANVTQLLKAVAVALRRLHRD